MTNEEIGLRISSRRTQLGFTMDDVAKKIGVARSTIQRYEKGTIEKIKLPVIESIASALSVDPDWIIGNTNDPTPGKCYGSAPNAKNIIPFPETARVPRIGRIACGEPITAEENIEGYDEVLSSWRADFTLVCCGDSMLPKIEDGDIVAIRCQPTVENGEIAAVRIGDEATLKQVFVHSDFIELRPLNPKYESIIKRKEEMLDIRIEGKAVGLCRNL